MNGLNKANAVGLSKSNLIEVALIIALMFLASLGARAQAQPQAQSQSQSQSNAAPSDDAVAANAAAADAAAAADVGGPALSKGFVVASLQAMSAMRDWQGHLAFMIRNGYPLAEQWLEEDGNRAQDLVVLAGQAATTSGDRAATIELTNQYRNLQDWNDYIVDAKRNMQLANLYLTPNGLAGDPQFQKMVDCANFLGPMLASGRLSESVSCQ
jgi:hypothetical protein